MARMPSKPNRRDFLTSAVRAGTLLTLTGPALIPSATAQGATSITVVSFGGSYGEFIRDEWNKAFTAETGIEVVLAAGPDLAKAKAMVQTKNIEWDVFDGAGSTVIAGARENLWEPIDTTVVDPSRFVVPIGRNYMPLYIYSGGVAWNPARTPKPARNFQQLWDVANYPGRRGLRTRVSETMEAALIADGVDPANIYPLDVERGFRSLERIKKDVKKWFEQTTQGISLIQTNECDYTYTYANRVRVAKESGVSIDFSFDQNINAFSYFAVLRGTPRKEAAMRYLEFVTRPASQAKIAEKLSFAPVAKGAADAISDAAKRWLPSLQSPSNLLVRDDYWADRFIELDRRFKEWILS